MTPYEYDGINNTVLLNQSGVAYAALIDFDGNGREELFICYNDIESKYNKDMGASSPCIYEVWGYNGSSYLIAKEGATVFGGGSMIRDRLDVYEKDKGSYVVYTLSHKEEYEQGTAWNWIHSYSTIIQGKWAAKKLERSEYDNKPVPWDGAEHIISFNELEYESKDANQLQGTLAELKKYSKE